MLLREVTEPERFGSNREQGRFPSLRPSHHADLGAQPHAALLRNLRAAAN